MTVYEANGFLKELRALEASGDRQASAAGVQTLLVEALRTIAEGIHDPQGLAATVLVAIDEELGDDRASPSLRPRCSGAVSHVSRSRWSAPAIR